MEEELLARGGFDMLVYDQKENHCAAFERKLGLAGFYFWAFAILQSFARGQPSHFGLRAVQVSRPKRTIR